MKSKNKLLSVIIFIALLMLPLVWIIGNAQKKQSSVQSLSNDTVSTPRNQPAKAEKPVEQSSPPEQLIIGNPNAPVTLIEYGDFQCPFCRQFYKQTEPDILKAYVDPGKVKIEFRVETHIGQESVRAGEAAYCANDQRKFKAYHDQLFDNQQGENNGAFSNANLKTFARIIGLDETLFNNCLDSQKYQAKVNEGNAEAKNRGVTSTPTIFIGANKVVGAQPFSIYQRLLDEQL